MNIHTKLRGMGFKKTQFRKPEYSRSHGEQIMVLDIEETKYEYIGGISKSYVVDKKHPKSNSFYVLNYSKDYTLWALIENHELSLIYLENKNFVKEEYSWMREKPRISVVYNRRNKDVIKPGCKNDIINTFPKELRRDYLLDQLFN